MTAAELDWRHLAACRGADPNLFIPDLGDRDSRFGANYPAEVVAMCATCPVQAPCLDYALSLERDLPGYWGGTTPRQRRALHADRRHRHELEHHQRSVRLAAAIQAGATVADLADAYGVTERTVMRYAAAGR